VSLLVALYQTVVLHKQCGPIYSFKDEVMKFADIHVIVRYFCSGSDPFIQNCFTSRYHANIFMDAFLAFTYGSALDYSCNYLCLPFI